MHEPGKEGSQPDLQDPPAPSKVPKECARFKTSGDCPYKLKCKFRHFTDPPTAGDELAISLGAPKAMSVIVGICAASDPEVEEDWALDTGAGIDVAGQGVAGEVTDLTAPTPIWSAGGMIASSQVLKTQIAPLQQAVDATILVGSPNALAVGRRCAEQGFAFYWKPFAPVPEVYLPSGERVPGVRADANYVPFVRNARPRGGPGKTMAMPSLAIGEPVRGPAAPADDDAGGGPELGAQALSPVKDQDSSLDDAEDRSLLQGVQRVIDAADRTDHDAAADAIAEASGFVAQPADPGADEQEYRVAAPSPLNPGHMAMHLPRLKGCPICDDAKHLHRYHRRRADVLFCLTGEDAASSPFGALLHLDWIEIRRGSSAARSAARALVLTDDLTSFMGTFPSHAKDADTVVEIAHRFDETPPGGAPVVVGPCRGVPGGQQADPRAATARPLHRRPLEACPSGGTLESRGYGGRAGSAVASRHA